MTNIATENGPVEIVDFPINSMVIFQLAMLVITHYHTIPPIFIGSYGSCWPLTNGPSEDSALKLISPKHVRNAFHRVLAKPSLPASLLFARALGGSICVQDHLESFEGWKRMEK